MASLDVIRTLTIRANAQGFPQAQAAVTDLGQAYDTSARRQLGMDRSLQNLERRFIQGAREAQEFARVQRQVNLITSQNPELQGRANRVLEEAGKQFRIANDNTTQYTNNNRLARHELINLSRQIQDVGVGLASGQGAMTIAIQQGSQIADVFASGNASLKGFAQQLVGMITPMRALLGVTALVAGAGALLYSNWKQTETLFLNLSERLDMPIAKLHELAQAAAVRGIDTTEFVKGMESFGDQVDRAQHGLGNLAGLFRVNGERAGDLTESLLKVADLVQNAASGAQRYRILQDAGLPPTAEWVRLLSQGSNQLKTQIEDTVKYNDANRVLIEQAREFDEAWSKAWTNFKSNATTSVAAALGFISSLIERASTFVTKIQAGVLSLRGFTPEQAQRRIGEQALGAGIGTRFELQDAAQFYDRIKAAGGEAGRERTKLLSDTQQLLGLEAQRIQMLGNLATMQEKMRAVEIQIQQARLQGVSITEREEQALLRIVEVQERARLSSETVAALGDAATATEEYQAIIDRLSVSLADTSISQETFNRAVIAANPLVRELSGSIESNMVRALSDIASGTTNAAKGFENMGLAIVTAINEAIIKLLIIRPLIQSVTQSLGPLLPSFGTSPGGSPLSLSPFGARGGIVGQDLPRRFVDPTMFIGAPHFQSGGLVGGEVPVIAHRGEGIFTPAQMRAMGGGDQIVNVNVQNAPTRPRVEQSRGADGSFNINVIFDQVEARIADNVRRGRGPMPEAMSGRFGLNPAVGNV